VPPPFESPDDRLAGNSHAVILTASQKAHLRRCASSFVIAAYFYVRLISKDSRALHLKLFTVPSGLTTFYQVINL
jgi:hypothetical protein